MDVTLVLTHDCNLGCGYCYAGRKFARAMPDEVADAALDLAFADGRPRVEIGYFGGEPTLAWEALTRAARRANHLAAARGVELLQTVTTNGTLLTQERVLELGELGVYVALSIDGNRAAHEANRPTMGGGSSWEGVSRGLDLVLEAGRPFETISVITPASVRELGASARELFERGVPRVSLNPCYEAAWTEADLAAWERGLEEAALEMAAWMRRGRVVSVNVIDAKILARLKGGLAREDKCALGEGAVAVAPSGNIYACERLVGEDDQPELAIGHTSLGVDAARVAAGRSPAVDGHATNDACTGCAERPRCSASCACANRAETGNPHVAGGVQCWHEQATARVADALAATLAAERNEAFRRWFLPGGWPPGLPVVSGPVGVVDRVARKLRVIQ